MDDREPTFTAEGAAFGCITAFLIFACVGFVLFFGLIWGGNHCEPMPQCRQDNAQRFLLEVLSLLLFVGVLGFLVRWLAGFIFRRMAGRWTIGASAINLLLALLAAWLGFELAIRLLLAF